MRWLVLFTVGALWATAAHAQQDEAKQRQELGHTKCADYLKAAAGSGWSSGQTGNAGIDQASAERTKRLHDFCTRNPDRMASDALTADQPASAK